METALDLSRWREAPRGVNYRRWVILSTGLRHLLRTRFFKILVYVAWFCGLMIAVGGYMLAQVVTENGWLQSAAAEAGPRATAVIKALSGLVALFPDVIVGGLFTLFVSVHSSLGLTLALLGITVMVPQLITRDRASHALTIYLSRPLTSGDYLLGKFGMIVGLLALVWTGPLLFGWLVSMMLAMDRDFLVHSLPPLLRALAFNGIALAVLAPLALGVSALARSSRGTIAIWIGVWIVAWGLAQFPHSPDWLRHASFSANLTQVREHVIPVERVLLDAADKLPVLDPGFDRGMAQLAERVRPESPRGPIAGLVVLVVLSSTVFLRRIRAE